MTTYIYSRMMLTEFALGNLDFAMSESPRYVSIFDIASPSPTCLRGSRVTPTEEEGTKHFT